MVKFSGRIGQKKNAKWSEPFMNIYRAIKEEMLVPIHPAGWPFIALFSAITVMVGLVFEPFFWIGIPASLWCVFSVIRSG